MKKNALPIGFLILGLAICFSLSLGLLILGPSVPGANEILSPAPALRSEDGSLNDSFLSDTAAWFADHFRWRQELITLWAKGNAALFGESVREDILLGKEGWLYYASTLPDYSGTNPMTEYELHAAASNLELMAQYCREQDAQFLFLCVPNKNTLYPQWMPDGPSPSEAHNYERLYEILEARGIPHLDLRLSFLTEDRVLYFAHDSHWNSRGAALGADLILNALGKESNLYSDSFIGSEAHTGDLFAMLYPAGTDDEPNPLYGGKLDYTFQKNSGKQPDSITIRTTSSAPGSLLMYRDSFGNLLFPYLASRFGSAMFSRSTAYDLSKMEDQSADTVVIELVERNLRYLIQNTPVMPAPERPLPNLAMTESTRLEEVKSTLEGYRLYRGYIAGMDDDSGVTLLSGNGAYECFLLEDGKFAAYIPENTELYGAACNVGGLPKGYSVTMK